MHFKAHELGWFPRDRLIYRLVITLSLYFDLSLKFFYSIVSDDKDAMKNKRQESSKKAEECLKEQSKMKDEVKRENEQYALKEIMKVNIYEMFGLLKPVTLIGSLIRKSINNIC